MGRNGVCLNKHKINTSSDSNSDERKTDSSSSSFDEEFIIAFVNFYFDVLSNLDQGFLYGREAIDDILISIIEYELKYDEMTLNKINAIADHFNIENNILLSKYLFKKNKISM